MITSFVIFLPLHELYLIKQKEHNLVSILSANHAYCPLRLLEYHLCTKNVICNVFRARLRMADKISLLINVSRNRTKNSHITNVNIKYSLFCGMR
jgi:hypothetical protein